MLTHYRHYSNHIETVQFTCRPIQSTGFYMIGLLLVNYLKLRSYPFQVLRNLSEFYLVISCQVKYKSIFVNLLRHNYPFKLQPHKMAKLTQTICELLPTDCLSVFDHFVELGFNGLRIKMYIEKLTPERSLKLF